MQQRSNFKLLPGQPCKPGVPLMQDRVLVLPPYHGGLQIIFIIKINKKNKKVFTKNGHFSFYKLTHFAGEHTNRVTRSERKLIRLE